jgi:hypothetical protein
MFDLASFDRAGTDEDASRDIYNLASDASRGRALIALEEIDVARDIMDVTF